MSGLVLSRLKKTFGSVVAVTDVTLELPSGRLISFVGPSGCGKTTLLRLIAGLERPTEGRVVLRGEDITERPTHKRNIGMVFQSLALFPHLTVGQNIAYALNIRGVHRRARERRVAELLELVRLPDFAERQISQLSGGQRQRVAIARALALEPSLFLLDEPLSALDAKLREAMQVELRLLQERLGITTIVVTHDQREAMTMSDLVVVMGAGSIQQVGAPLEIYRKPASVFVADFIGTSNILRGRTTGDHTLEIQGARFRLGEVSEDAFAGPEVTISVRPEDVVVLTGAQPGDNRLVGHVMFVRDLGMNVETFVDCGGTTIVSLASPRERPHVRQGEAATVEIPKAACVVLRT